LFHSDQTCPHGSKEWVMDHILEGIVQQLEMNDVFDEGGMQEQVETTAHPVEAVAVEEVAEEMKAVSLLKQPVSVIAPPLAIVACDGRAGKNTVSAGGGQDGSTLTEWVKVPSKHGSFVVYKFGEM
jgi:hypothetical protein